MELECYFFDTFALIEITRGNANYNQYINDKGIVTTKLNLMELYYCLLREHDKSIAESYFSKLNRYCIDFDDDTLKEAMQIKLKQRNANKNWSYIDALGYVIAKSMDIPFLTGDREFKDIENVIFIPASSEKNQNL